MISGAMDVFAPEHRIPGSSAFPGSQTELRWQDSELWPVRRPYPIDVPCPACGDHVRCDSYGRQRCPNGHEFGQRAFWNGRAESCWLLLEDACDGRTFILPDLTLRWSDHGRLVVAAPDWQAGEDDAPAR